MVLAALVHTWAPYARPAPLLESQKTTSTVPNAPGLGVEIVQHNGYPELRVEGQPFFPNSAAFFYTRIPRQLWESSLDQYRALGINTIDLYIVWNWHEPREGELDFDGHTNPRRDLRGLLNLIARKGFKLIARPGPTILNEWRNGGYPDWLLDQAPYQMPLADRLEGRYPPPAALNTRDAEGAARAWMASPVHMEHARKWLEAVARELAPYLASATLHLTPPEPKKGKEGKETAGRSGPLLFVQIEDDLAIGRANSPGSEFWKYVETLCGVLRRGGVDAPCFINPTAPPAPAAGSRLATPIYTMGQWYLPPESSPALSERYLAPADLGALEQEAALLGTQPGFPPLLIEYDAGWYAPGDDARPQPGPVSNSLLSAGLLLGAGIRGLNWFPLQDTLTPAGFGTPWTNRSYCWDAALSLTGAHRARYPAVERIGRQLQAWGKSLAASHRRADFAVVDPLLALPREKLTGEDAERFHGTTGRLLRLADYAGLSADLVDVQHQPPEQLLRYPLLLLPVYRPGEQEFAIAEKAERTLTAYLRAGGSLVCFPELPAGRVFQELRGASPALPGPLPEGAVAQQVGSGRLILLTKDFYSWVGLGDDFSDGRNRFEAPYGISVLKDLLHDLDLRPVVQPVPDAAHTADFMASELVSDEGTGLLGERSGGQGWLSVSNLSYDTPLAETLEVISPRASTRTPQLAASDILKVPVSVPPAESLLLPLEFPLCSEPAPGHACEDRIISSGAELVRAEREGKTMQLTFCAPARATVRLRLAEKPGHSEMDGNPIPAVWNPDEQELTVDLLRGASPAFLRVLRIPLPYAPALPELPSPENRRPSPAALRLSALGGVRLPVGEDSNLLAEPPLFVLEKGADASLRFAVENLGETGGELQLRINGTFESTARTYVPGGMLGTLSLPVRSSDIESASATPPGADGLYRGTLHTIPAGPSDNSQVFFAILPEKGGIGYTFDLDADGQPERLLENSALRAIVSPAAGGRLIALLDKATNLNLTSTMGMFEDGFSFSPNPPGVRPERARGRSGTFNRFYTSEWRQAEGGPALQMSYDAPDVYPHGAHIEKTFQLSGERAGSVEYRVSLLLADAQRLAQEASGKIFAAPAPTDVPQHFVILSSLPAAFGDGPVTKFCWTHPGVAASAAAPADRCESLAPGGQELQLPPEVKSLEIRQPQGPALILDWPGAGDGARLTLEPKRYSVLLRLSCASLQPGGAPGLYRIEFKVVEPQ